MKSKIYNAINRIVKYNLFINRRLMLKEKIIFIFFQLFITSKLLLSQDSHKKGYFRHSWIGGVQIGYNISRITALETTILSEPFFLKYSLKAKNRRGIIFGLLLNKRFESSSHLGMQFEMMFSQQGSKLNFINNEKDFYYTMKFGYQYINFIATAKLYPTYGSKICGVNIDGVNLNLGFQLGFNIARENIIYRSGGSGIQPAFGTDSEQEQQLRNVLKGKNNYGPVAGIGYEFHSFPIIIDVRAFYGISDVTETLANSYNFIPTKNTNCFIQGMIAFYIGRKK